VYSSLCEGYGWGLEEVKEYSELELIQSIINLRKIKKNKTIENLNMNSIAFAAGSGNKEANKQIDKMNKEQQRETRKYQNKGLTSGVDLSELTPSKLQGMKWVKTQKK
jgi:hypothetical protein